MKNVIMYIRSIIFMPLFYVWSFGIGIVCLPCLVLPSKWILFVPAVWTAGNRLLLYVICGIKIKIEGKENLPKKNGYLVASKHESAMETIVFHSLFPQSIYVLKKSLLMIPVAGWYFARTGCIAIDRSKGTTAMRALLDRAQQQLKKGFNIIIFPEGTRVKPGAEPRYNPGVSLIYEKCGVPVIPVALNTGYFWPKNSIKRYPGTVRVAFLPPIQPGLDKREFMKELQDKIETKTQELTP